MPKNLQFARPMMGSSTGFDADQARRQLLKKCQDVPPPQLAADDHTAFSVDAVDLKTPIWRCRDQQW
jgi:hypothetical protein